MNDRPWLSAYPAGVPADVATDAYASLADLLTTSFKAHGDKIAFSFMGQELSYSDLDQQSRQLAAFFICQSFTACRALAERTNSRRQ